MAYVLDKLKSFFASNASSLLGRKRAAMLSYVRTDVDPTQIWQNVEPIGDGAFGQIYKAVHKTTDQLAALKQVSVASADDLEDHTVEISILAQFSHKNVVRLIEAYHFDGKLWIYLEYCAGGAVDRIMYELERPLAEPQIRCVCRQVCEGLVYLHGNGVIHRDLKASNVLLTGEGLVKLADFGVSAKNHQLDQRRTSFIGTPYWMAPEVITCETIKDKPYDYKADIWSLGITLIECAQMHPPNHQMNPARVTMRIARAEPPTLDLPHKWSTDFNDFLTKCLQKAPEARLSAIELLQHSFLADCEDCRPMGQLVSEAHADDVTIEVKDVDDVTLEVKDNVKDKNDGEDSLDSATSSSGSSESLVTSFINPQAEKSHGTDLVVPSSNKNRHALMSTDSSSPSLLTNGAQRSIANHITSPDLRPLANNGRSTVFPIRSPFPPTNHNASVATDLNKNTANGFGFHQKSEKAVKRVVEEEEQTESIFIEDDYGDEDDKRGNDHLTKQNGFTSSETNASHVEKNGMGIGVIKQNQNGLAGKYEGLVSGKQNGIEREKDKSFANGKGVNGKLMAPVIFTGTAAKRLLQVSPVVPVPGGRNGGEGGSGGRERVGTMPQPDHDGGGFSLNRRRSHYRSLTKTRRYVYEGQVHMTQTSKIVLHGDENRPQEELATRKASLRALKLLQMLEHQQHAELERRFRAQRDQLDKQFDLKSQELLRSCAAEGEQLAQEQRLHMERLEASHTLQCRTTSRNIKAQQEKDLKSFQEGLRRDLRGVREEGEALPKEWRRDLVKRLTERKEVEQAEMERKFLEQQYDALDAALHRLALLHRDELCAKEKLLLAQKHQQQRAREGAVWETEESYLLERSALNRRQLQQTFELMCQQASHRHAEELGMTRRANERAEVDLQRRQAAERKQTIRVMKEDTRARLQAFRDSLRAGLGGRGLGDGGLRGGTSPDTERDKLQEFEDAERRRVREVLSAYELRLKTQTDELRARCAQSTAELQLIHSERQRSLAEREKEKMADESEKLNARLARWQRELSSRKRVLEDEFSRQVADLERFYSGSAGGHGGPQGLHPTTSLDRFPPASSPRRGGSGGVGGDDHAATWTVDTHMSTAL